MTRKFMTVRKARGEIERLQNYITLVENYDDNTLEKCMIKEYAYTYNITEVMKRMNDKWFQKGDSIDRKAVTAVIDGKPIDELHRIVRQGYRVRNTGTVLAFHFKQQN